jgi:redox-sensitive bicupin YhaK (pirin superfamily)
MGTGSVIRPGDVQAMSAGTGITHSEFNGSSSEEVHFLQIWLLPTEPGGSPRYDQKTFASDQKLGRLRLVASADGRDGSVRINTDAAVYAGVFDANQSSELQLAPDRHAWVQVTRGRLSVNGQELKAGDGAALTSEPSIRLKGAERSEVLVFDLR